MKRCPKCNRSYPDDNQKFCTFDGGLLTSDQKPFDPNATIQSTTIPREPTSEESSKGRADNKPLPDFGATIATSSSAPTAVLPKQTGPTGSRTSSNMPPPQPPPAAPRQSAPPLPQLRRDLPPVVVAPPKKKSKLPLILGILAILLLLGIAAVVAAFFLVIKPRLDQRLEGPVVTRTENENVNNNTNTNTAANTNANTNASEEAKTQPEFVAPPNTVQFTNSSADLDGKLAEHYIDFSFYYPNNWLVDPKAGVAGSGNFAKVERRLPPDFTQENFAVRWYESQGTYAADLQDFPRKVEELSGSLAKAFPEYRKVSEGPTKINSLDAYEFRWVGLSKGTEKGDLQLWGRVVFVPTGVAGDKDGVVLTMFTTSLAPELSGLDDVGTKGQMPVILESFRLGKKR
jgi:hypothetical protein